MRWAVRAPTWAELEVLRERVVGCLEAAGRASACAVAVSAGVGYKDCRNNSALGASIIPQDPAGSRRGVRKTDIHTR